MITEAQMTAWLCTEARKFMDLNGLGTITPAVIERVMEVAPDNASAALAIQKLMGN